MRCRARACPHASLAPPGLEAPRRLADLGSRTDGVAPSTSPASDTERLAWLLRPGAAPPPRGDGTVTLVRAGGREPEVDDAFRRILAAGWRLDAVEIACVSDEDATLVWEKAQRHDWPVTVEGGVPVARTRPARALLGFLRVVRGRLPRRRAPASLQSGDVRLDLDDGPSPGQAARLLVRVGGAVGPGDLRRDAGRAGAPSFASEPPTPTSTTPPGAAASRAAQVERLARRPRRAAEPRPGARQGRRDLDPRAPCRRATFLGRFAAVGGPLDGAAVLVIGDALDELDALGDLRRPQAEILRLVRDRLAGLAVGGDRARPGCLHVAPLARAGYAGPPAHADPGAGGGARPPAAARGPRAPRRRARAPPPAPDRPPTGWPRRSIAS